jgi:hypothetical protein
MKKNLIFNLLSKQLLMSAILLFAGNFLSVEMMAVKPQAIPNGNGDLQLPTDVALADSYEFSTASFQSEEQAMEFFRLKSHSEDAFRVNMSQHEAYVYLTKKAYPNWTLTEWNNILYTKTTSSPLLI